MHNFSDTANYEIVEKIAEGGMGVVYKARQHGIEGFSKTVAIKTLLPRLSNNQYFIKSFIAEAKLVANLIHENIVQIYQLSKVDDIFFFVLEFINGISLHDLMKIHVAQKIKLPMELAVYITSRIARGLAYAHNRGDGSGKSLDIVHCDICPKNILITTEGLPKLTDFGLARAVTMNEDQGHILGKLAFMSPEQANAEDVDFRSDIYSLGMVFFFLLTGKHVRNLDFSNDYVLAQASAGAIPWEKLDNLDSELQEIARKMLAKDPAERYDDTNLLGRDLEYFIYKDGYGPTIVTLENYLRKHCAYLYSSEPRTKGKGNDYGPKVVLDKTRVI